MESPKLFQKPKENEQLYTYLNIDVTEHFRIVHMNPALVHTKFSSNRVVTAKYSILTWLPKSLFMQFTRINNIYFLIMSILSFMPFSPKNPFSLAGTFAAVLIFTMFKEGYEDLARHKQDRQMNKKVFLKYSKLISGFVEVESQNVVVGDILKIRENESFPADLVMIATSNIKSIAYVNTMNLDGETNLKEKFLPNGVFGQYEESSLSNLNFELQVDHPNNSLVKWNCNIKFPTKIEPLSLQQLLLRGCMLKNTDWVFGIAVYTGPDSKIVMNSKKAPTKSSKIQKSMNFILISVFILQILICFFLAAFGQKWLKDHSDADYIDLPTANSASFILKVLTYWVGYSHLIPISLYVALELVRLFLANFIKNDLSMYEPVTDRPANCRASDLIDELGQVEFIFSYKTGTLTCNEMVFRKCCIENCVYEVSENGNCEEIEKIRIQEFERGGKGLVSEFLLMLALCNSVFPAKHQDKIVYQASSPDELALVEAGKILGYTLKEKSEGKVFVSVDGEVQVWELLAEIPFNSYRKRMSTVFKNSKNNEIKIFTKGADSTMLSLIEESKAELAKSDLLSFAKEGFRTLVFASQTIPYQSFTSWYSTWREIQLTNDENKEDLLSNHGSILESHLNLIATTAIEDKLQEGVPETIDSLMKANIRLWVLTGDKEETAIEIAKSCNLIQPDMEVIEIFLNSTLSTKDYLTELSQSFGIFDITDFKQLDIVKNSLNMKLALVVNGTCLSFILENEELKSLFFRLGFISNSCICCRVSPAQKMKVVRLAKTYGKWISLAIGDGANDVSMIQEAHIGVGIAGKEGTQAIQAADFTFCEFKSLRPLLLVHGRYAYNRISMFILYYFYKNFLSVFIEIWFAFYSGFSGQIFFLDWLPALYNTFWTSWPCLTFFSLERDLMPNDSLEYFNLYAAGQKSVYFNIKIFWKWILFSFCSACWIYWLPILGYEKGSDRLGKDQGLFWISTVSFILLIHTVNYKLLLISHFWNKLSL